jgi:hypothetical protein
MPSKRADNKSEDTSIEDTLSILDPVKTLIEVQGEPFKIQQFKFVEALKIMKIVKDHPNAIPFELFQLNTQTDTDQMIDLIIKSLSEFGDGIFEILKTYLKKDDEWMEKLEIDEVVDITLAIVKVNMDFFTQKLLPKFQPKSTKENS